MRKSAHRIVFSLDLRVLTLVTPARQEDAALRAKEEARQRQAAERAAQLEAERRERDARFDELQVSAARVSGEI
eukprot:6180101-Pleurochrysis_carterae.AAC.1